MEQTRWRVITGAPCSGKTSVIDELARRHFPVVHEAARAYIGEQLDRGLSLEAIKVDALAFETAILHRKVALEAGLGKNQTIFLDRAVPDSIAYFRLEGLDCTTPIALSRQRAYRQIFIFAPLPFQVDRVRREDSQQAHRLDRLIMESYTALGYRPLRVPPGSVSARAAFILDRLE